MSIPGPPKKYYSLKSCRLGCSQDHKTCSFLPQSQKSFITSMINYGNKHADHQTSQNQEHEREKHYITSLLPPL